MSVSLAGRRWRGVTPAAGHPACMQCWCEARIRIGGSGTRSSGAPKPVRRRRSSQTQSSDKEQSMNKHILEGNWKQLKGKVKERWGKLTDDQLDVIEGKRDQLLGRIQESYGISKEEAERQVNEFEQVHVSRRH